MTAPAVSFSPQSYARICGVLYLYIIAAGTFAELFVRSKLVVSSKRCGHRQQYHGE